MATEIESLSNGIKNGHIITFNVNDDIYQIVQVQDGGTVVEPAEPTINEQIFQYWKTDLDTQQTFPITSISEDINLTAYFTEGAWSSLTSAGQTIATFTGDRILTKDNDGWCICGKTSVSSGGASGSGVVVVGKTVESVAYTLTGDSIPGSSTNATSFSYTINGETKTYYYKVTYAYGSTGVYCTVPVGCPDTITYYYSNPQNAAITLLDKYYQVS